MLWDQNNQRSLPADLQDGPNPAHPALCFSFWISIGNSRVGLGKEFKLKRCGAKVKRLSGHDNVLMLQWVSNE
ncbi:hypothetical protein KUCAC02_010570 [Chaenocephalus aceratus]|uniref:Uncharacterized protein n=1 Tax=Chaenocephalus aceratus TaxID=36190 RepID=A0ACB9VZE0_CHAAC|nr:hypothetical protein KUCAC02_010570 [Chaenocephalus aceratus]